ncbi:low molecular weight protein-tyrosine-phosphatase [Streptococcus pseudoporcinus]|uniref:protein-tyrosine-phosphatase n=1 Tax=Streptococcus pseudoporcinus TaxID=361101 RepID=A0A4U9XGM0_9STRE|nr:low molecular weight protein-tyrosine-phosphatase [Streptococcus pseudoporcinus]VTS12274.1 phosphotyrosine protein phosphatase [Streptococcus pseudoporcinus]VUC64800.1 phosphotyrosine protein phosphatase [Streptococcus pseudoporcinus]VUC95274.1 phosphotyrosine protein phosphatase [Streptococcus pseudoporcinus]VUC95496.1 phosphotyrosine protein phosphatase [Streptococcus pseudoporcinus]
MKKVCFVCLGNICRSTMAEFVMKSLIEDDEIVVESRGTSNWEQGNPIHPGTQNILRNYAIPYNSNKKSQQVTKEDLATFDYIIGMDRNNVADLQELSAGQWDDKVFLFNYDGVPDPWYTGDFEETYRLVLKGCQEWLDTINYNKDMS